MCWLRHWLSAWKHKLNDFSHEKYGVRAIDMFHFIDYDKIKSYANP